MSERNEFLSEPGKPYVPADLQRQFHGMTPRDVYALLCKRQGCKCISAVLGMLPNKENGWEDVTSLDLGRTYVGARGAQVVIELCKLLSCLRSISLADNYLDNQSAWMLSKMAVYHPSLATVDVRNNPISWVGGMSLLELASRNNVVQSISVGGTHIHANVQEYIAIQTRRNACTRDRHARRGANPSNHPLTLKLRALKRYFFECCNSLGVQNGKLPKQYLEKGTREALRLSGREDEARQYPPEMFQLLMSKSPEEVGWETFMLLCMCQDASMDSGVISKLRFIFDAFDIGQADYVDAKDLGDMMSCMHNGVAPSPEVVATKKAYFDLDDTMTIQWDEFLLMLYDNNTVNSGSRLTVALESPIGTSGSVSSVALCR